MVKSILQKISFLKSCWPFNSEAWVQSQPWQLRFFRTLDVTSFSSRKNQWKFIPKAWKNCENHLVITAIVQQRNVLTFDMVLEPHEWMVASLLVTGSNSRLLIIYKHDWISHRASVNYATRSDFHHDKKKDLPKSTKELSK